MEHAEFRIGLTFYTGSGAWRCTDVGTRTIAAIRTEGVKDLSLLNGPTYYLAETVFDEDDFPGCTLEPQYEFAALSQDELRVSWERTSRKVPLRVQLQDTSMELTRRQAIELHQALEAYLMHSVADIPD
jgi:hypothetical protein